MSAPSLKTLVLLMLFIVLPASANNAAALFAEGLEAYKAEDYERAMNLFEQATRLEPTASKYHDWLGRATGLRAERVNRLRAFGLARKARASFERAVELDGANVEALFDLLEYYLEAPGFLGGGEDKARAIAARLSQISPAAGHSGQARVLSKRKDYAAAEREYRQALELEPTKLVWLLDLGSFFASRGRYGEAEGLFEQAAQLDPDSPALLFARAKALALSRKNPQEARRLLEDYLRSPRKAEDPSPSEVKELLKRL